MFPDDAGDERDLKQIIVSPFNICIRLVIFKEDDIVRRITEEKFYALPGVGDRGGISFYANDKSFGRAVEEFDIFAKFLPGLLKHACAVLRRGARKRKEHDHGKEKTASRHEKGKI